MTKYYEVNKHVLPLKANLAIQKSKYDKASGDLQAAQELFDAKEAELAEVMAIYDEAMRKKNLVLEDARACQEKMDAAAALIEGLADEKIRWTDQLSHFKSETDRLVGDVIQLTAFLSYVGPFNQEFRLMFQRVWTQQITDRNIPASANLSIIDSLTDMASIGEWNLRGLPNDELSIQNGIIVTKAARYPLLIDPQAQGKTWINNMEKENGLIVTSLNHKYFRNHFEDCVSQGKPILIEDVGEDLDPALDNVLEKNLIKIGTAYKVKVGEKEIDFNADFRLYITTKLANPLYTPEISARTSIIDFAVTMQGLEDQLLGRVILSEKKELEEERTNLIKDVTANRRKMQELEANLLHKLSTTQGSLLDDVSVIIVLNNSKTTSKEVNEKLNIARTTEVKINVAREEFRPVATRGSVLYFLVCTMAQVNVMYQTSLVQFLERFDVSLERSDRTHINRNRIRNIINYLTYEIYRYKTRGLYETHKFLFGLLMALQIDQQRGAVSYEEFQTFVKGGAALDLNACPPVPFPWITDITWLNLVQLSQQRQFAQIVEQVTNNERQWRQWFQKNQPEEEPIPDDYSKLDTFRRLLLIRAWCPDRTYSQSRKYIGWSLGERFAEPLILNYETMLIESRPLTPLICFLSMGSDPTPNIQSLAKKQETTVEAISMGQGQEVHARKLVAECLATGGWTLLQNCHLGLEYMAELVGRLAELEKDPSAVHPNFRLWITTEVHSGFPISLLQSSVKFTNEPPSGMRAGLERTYGNLTQDFLDYSESPYYLPLVYGVSFMHSVVQERRKFGALGWNIPYEFNSADWLASCMFMQNHLEQLDARRGISWPTVRYMLGEVQYGGRVTDDYDKRLLNTLAKVYFSERLFADDFEFYGGPQPYRVMRHKLQEEYLASIAAMSAVDVPQAYGLHPNADITYQTNTTQSVLDTIISVQPKESAAGGAGGESREQAVTRMVLEMQSKLPPVYVVHEVREQLVAMGILQSMVIFLRQEVDRMQKVRVIRECVVCG